MESRTLFVKDESEYFGIVDSLRAQFGQPAFEAETNDLTSPQWLKLTCIYYYSLRCSFQPICTGGGIDARMQLALDDIRAGCMGDARVLAAAHVMQNSPIAPDWFDDLISRLRQHPNAATAAIAKATDFEIDVRASALVGIERSGQRWRVAIPSMLKAYLGQIAQLFLNPIYVADGQDDDGRGAEDAADLLLHMLWLTREEFNPVALPALHPQSQQMHELALAVADAQLAYLCLHEIAHAALGHTAEEGAASSSREEGQRYAYRISLPDGTQQIVSSSVPIDEPFAETLWNSSAREQEEVDADAWAELRLSEMGWSSDVVTLAVALSTLFLTLSSFVCRCRFVDGKAELRPVSKGLEQRLWRSRVFRKCAKANAALHEILDWSDHLGNVMLYRLGRLTADGAATFRGTRPWD